MIGKKHKLLDILSYIFLSIIIHYSVDYNCKQKDNGDIEGEFDFCPSEGYYRGMYIVQDTVQGKKH